MKSNGKIPFFEVNFSEDEAQAVQEVIAGKWLSMGSKVREFEENFAETISVRRAIAVSNCTAALHLALHLLGIGSGDEVLVPSLTFVATVNAVKMVGATPVFVDIKSLDDWTLSALDAERKITSKTKAMIVMHYGGFICDMDAFQQLAKKYNLSIVEDAAHAPYATFKGKPVGSWGDFSCFSFYANKNITTGEGGMLVTNDEAMAERASKIRTHGLTTSAYERSRGGKFYTVNELGFNYRLTELQGALGVVQLKKLKKDIEQRRELVCYYNKKLSGFKGIRLPFQNYEGVSANYIYPILLEGLNRETIIAALQEQGIYTSHHYPPVHLMKHYLNPEFKLPLTEQVGEQGLSLPLFFNLTFEQIDTVCDLLRETVYFLSKKVFV